MKFVIYKTKSKFHPDVAWRWRLKGRNGEVVAQGEDHPTKELAKAAIKRIKRGAFFASVVVDEF